MHFPDKYHAQFLIYINININMIINILGLLLLA